MTRGGARKERDGPERRCAVTGERAPPEMLVRFALSPDGVVTPDVAEKLPGRGVWVSAEAAALEKAVSKNAFARGFKAPVTAPEGLPELVRTLLRRRVVEALSLCRKAGSAVAGFERGRETLPAAVAIVQARDGSVRQTARFRGLAGGLEEHRCLGSEELGLAFGRSHVIHIVMTAGGATARALRELRRLTGALPSDDGSTAPR